MTANASRYGFYEPYNSGRCAGYTQQKWHWSYKALAAEMLKDWNTYYGNNVCSFVSAINFTGIEACGYLAPVYVKTINPLAGPDWNGTYFFILISVFYYSVCSNYPYICALCILRSRWSCHCLRTRRYSTPIGLANIGHHRGIHPCCLLRYRHYTFPCAPNPLAVLLSRGRQGRRLRASQ